MAKFVALVFVAAWLAVALPMILCVDPKTEPDFGTLDWLKYLIRNPCVELHDENGCKTTNCMSDLIWSVVISKFKHSRLFKPSMKSFKQYLVTCGFEKRFKEVVVKHGVAIKQDDSSLAKYISKVLLKGTTEIERFYVDRIKGALEILDKLHKLDKMDLNTCDMKTTKRISDLADVARQPHHNEQFNFIGNIVAECVEVCARDLKNKIEEFKKNHKETWNPIKKMADEIKTIIAQKHKNSERTSRYWTIDILDKLPLDTQQDQRRNCEVLWAKIETNIDAIVHDCTPAITDDEIKEFINDIAHCELWQPYEVDLVHNTFSYLNAPNYPTMAEVPEAKPEECRNWGVRAMDVRLRRKLGL